MKNVRSRLAISIALLWTVVYLLIGIGSVCILHGIGKSHNMDVFREYKEDILIFTIIMLVCFCVSLALSYAVSWAYTQDVLIVEEKRVRYHGFFYEYKEFQEIRIRRFLLVWMVKIKLPDAKPTTFFVGTRAEADRLLVLWKAERKN